MVSAASNPDVRQTGLAWSVTLDGPQLAALEQLLAGIDGGADKALMRAINRTGGKVRTKTLRTLADELGMKQADLDVRKGRHRYGGVELSQASPDRLQANLSVTGRRIPIFRFGARQGRAGVSYRIGVKGRATAAHTFVARMDSGHVGVFHRLGQKVRVSKGRYAGRLRQAIYETFGPSIPHAMEKNPQIKQLVDVDTGATLEREVAAQIDLLLGQKGAGAAAMGSGTSGGGADSGGEE